MNKLRFFILLIVILFVESLILSFITVLVFKIFDPTADYNLFFGLLIFTIVFMFTKCLVELWMVFLIAIALYSRDGDGKGITTEIMIKSRIFPWVILAVILVAFATEGGGRFLVYLILYIPSVVLTYVLLLKYLSKYRDNWFGLKMKE